MTNIFLKKVKERINLTVGEELFLVSIIKKMDFESKEFFIQPGQICSEIGFIENGIFRIFNINIQGDELTNWLSIDGDILTEIFSFVNQIPSQEYIQSIEKSKMYYITNTDLQLIYKEVPKFHVFMKLIYEEMLMDLKRNIFANIHKNSKERYDHLMLHSPSILQRVPLKYIASFLGMTDSTLSRVRKPKNN